MGVHVNGSSHQDQCNNAGMIVPTVSSDHVMILDEDDYIQMSSADQEEAAAYDEAAGAATHLPSRLPERISVQDGSIRDMRHGGSRSGLKSFRSVSSRNVLSSIPTTDSISVQVGMWQC